jgi:hypothetical protein
VIGLVVSAICWRAATDKASRTATFTRAVQNMKVLAEGGTLPLR